MHIGFKISFIILECYFYLLSMREHFGSARLIDQQKDAILSTHIANIMNTKYKWDRASIVKIISN